MRLPPGGRVPDGVRSQSQTPLVGASSELVFRLNYGAPRSIEGRDDSSLL